MYTPCRARGIVSRMWPRIISSPKAPSSKGAIFIPPTKLARLARGPSASTTAARGGGHPAPVGHRVIKACAGLRFRSCGAWLDLRRRLVRRSCRVRPTCQVSSTPSKAARVATGSQRCRPHGSGRSTSQESATRSATLYVRMNRAGQASVQARRTALACTRVAIAWRPCSLVRSWPSTLGRSTQTLVAGGTCASIRSRCWHRSSRADIARLPTPHRLRARAIR